jgi:hypothetical protein
VRPAILGDESKIFSLSACNKKKSASKLEKEETNKLPATLFLHVFLRTQIGILTKM